MRLCPNCGANIDGLVGWCDCCGMALLSNEYVVLFEHDYIEAGDIGKYLNDAVANLNKLGLEQFSSSFSRIELITYCYPIQLARELNLTSRIRLSRKDRKATVTVVFNYEIYIKLSAAEKAAYVNHTLNVAILDLFQKKQPECMSEVRQRLTAT